MTHPIIFDLDGTLIDSAPGILAALDGAFSRCGLVPRLPLSVDIIGPPLMETLGCLAETTDLAVLRPLAEAFMANYDEHGYRLTTIFPGVGEMLAELTAHGYDLHIATNKRVLLTRRILNYLAWENHFSGVYALDAFDPPLKSKANMLGAILAEREFEPRGTLYIGDRQEDGEAARSNRMPFLLATWGYSKPATTGMWDTLASPRHLVDLVRPQ